jgi:hypothetical protein
VAASQERQDLLESHERQSYGQATQLKVGGLTKNREGQVGEHDLSALRKKPVEQRAQTVAERQEEQLEAHTSHF